VQGKPSAALLAIEPQDFDDQFLVIRRRWGSLYDWFLGGILSDYLAGFLGRKAGFTAQKQRQLQANNKGCNQGKTGDLSRF
ncbi:MAG: hypothetical protein ACKOAH_11445, partial [Pirellula sp.]